jgi:hypothetical protein
MHRRTLLAYNGSLYETPRGTVRSLQGSTVRLYCCTNTYDHFVIFRNCHGGRLSPSTAHFASIRTSSGTRDERHLTSMRLCMRPSQRSVCGTIGLLEIFSLQKSLGIPLEKMPLFWTTKSPSKVLPLPPVNYWSKTFVGGKLSDALRKYAG